MFPTTETWHHIYVFLGRHATGHDNPIRKGLVEVAADWPWSSCRAWESGVDEPVPIDRESFPVLER